MIIATPPPAIQAPVKSCADVTPVMIAVGDSITAYSPDCRWAFSVKASDISPPLNVPGGFDKKNAVLVSMATGQRQSDFLMENSAALHWLKDGRYAVINYFDGSGAAQPLLFNLKKRHPPSDLAALIFPDVLVRSHIHKRQVFHYYVYFLEDQGKSMTISAQPVFTLQGSNGSDEDRCYIYSVNKATLRYSFVRDVVETDTHPCPHNLDERWN